MIIYQPATDDYDNRNNAGVVFVDVLAACDTVNHRRFLCKVLEMTGYLLMTELIPTKLESRRLFVVLNGKKSRWQRHRHALPHGHALAPMLLNIFTNDQPIQPETRRFIYAHDLCITSRGKEIHNIEATLKSVLDILTSYYELNQLRPNPPKTQVCAFPLRNRDAKLELNVVWNDTRIISISTPLYLGIHLDRTPSYKVQIEKTKIKSLGAKQHISKTCKFEVGVESVNTKNTLYRPLLLDCRIRLSCLGKDYTCKQVTYRTYCSNKRR